MSENNNDINTWLKKFAYFSIVVCTILVACIIAVTIWMTNVNNAEEYRHTFEPPVLVLHLDSTTTNIDSIVFTELKQKLDTISIRQYEWYEGYLSDLRQESNNNINKYNGWLSFWIALLTIVLTIFPLFFNLRIEAKHKEEMERMRVEIEKQFDSKIQENIDKLEDYKKKVDADLHYYQNKFYQLKVQNSAMGISAITDAKIFADDNNRETHWRVFLVDFNTNLRNFLESYENAHPKGHMNFNQQPVREVLVHIYFVLNLWSSKLKGKSQSKRVIVLMNKVSTLLANNEHKPGESISDYYRDYYEEFHEIVYMIDALIKEKT